MAEVNAQTVGAFTEFVDKARALLPDLPGSPDAPTLEKFERLIEVARDLIVEPIRDRREQIREDLVLIQSMILPAKFDLLQTAGLTFAEDAYTELMAWVLNPGIQSSFALALQKTWLSSLGIQEVENEIDPAIPVTQFWTDDGIPDLVLAYRSTLVVVEAKTGTAEHTTPRSGKFQTESYGIAARRALGLENSHTTHTVYVTVDGSPARNPDAVSGTYFHFAVAVARVLNSVDVEDAYRWPYTLVATHLATCAVPSGMDVRKMVHAVLDVHNDTQLVRNLENMIRIMKLLGAKGE